MNWTYNVKLDTFEGPLDLLLHLINRLEIDIYDIPVAEITNQYMQYIQAMKKIELNIASEYLLMAATLIEMKSKMLLPKKEEQSVEDSDEIDPREQLIERLIEYRKYKQIAEMLKEKELEENEVYTRPPIAFDHLIEHDEATHETVSIYDMIEALGKMLKRKHWNAPIEATVQRIDISIDERMEEIKKIVYNQSHPVPFEDLFPYPSKSYIVTTLLAILQLLKTNELSCKQKNNFAPIYVYRKTNYIKSSE